MKRKLVALAALALLLTGCSSSISSGTITAKVHEPGHYYSSQVCNLIGKVMVCTPITSYDDEDWRFDIVDGEKTGYIYVTKESFDKFEVGDYVQGEE